LETHFVKVEVASLVMICLDAKAWNNGCVSFEMVEMSRRGGGEVELAS